MIATRNSIAVIDHPPALPPDRSADQQRKAAQPERERRGRGRDESQRGQRHEDRWNDPQPLELQRALAADVAEAQE
jgi:hypothetical protein